MAITEDDRYRLYQHLEEVLGREHANTLMEHLPPVGWADVATKQDLDHLRASIEHQFELRDLRFEAIDRRFEAIDRRFEQVDQRFDQIDRRFDQLEQRFDQRLDERLDQRFDNFRLEIRGDLERALRMQTFALIGLMFTMLSAFVALQQSIS